MNRFNIMEQSIIPKHLAKAGIWEMTVSCVHNHTTKTDAILCLEKIKKKCKKSPPGYIHRFWIQDTAGNRCNQCSI